MKEKNIERYSPDDLKPDMTDWKRVQNMTDEEIDKAARSDPDAQPTDAEYWKGAKIVMPEPKAHITLRVDQDVLHWFKKRGKGYQTRMNAVLRAYIDSQKKKAG